MSETKHTPLPWFAELAAARGSGNEFVADCDDHTPYYLSPTCTANAALIARAVNAHADLLAVARLALVMFCDPHTLSIDPAARNLKALAEAAVAKGKGAA